MFAALATAPLIVLASFAIGRPDRADAEAIG
jgi:hypothetical protein